MDITASQGKFFVAAFRIDKSEYGWNKDGSLSISGKRKYPLKVQTERGDFVECLDESGKIISEGGDGEWYCIQPKPEKQALRFKSLPAIKLTAIEKKKRVEVKRYLVDGSPHSLGIPNNLSEAIKWLSAKLAEIPKDCRASAEVDFDNSFSYGESYSNIEITYLQPETDEELIRRLQIEVERARVAKIKKVAQFERLKAELHR